MESDFDMVAARQMAVREAEAEARAREIADVRAAATERARIIAALRNESRDLYEAVADAIDKGKQSLARDAMEAVADWLENSHAK